MSTCKSRSGISQPFVSVIVPTLNSKETLKKCLDSIFYQDYPSHLYEVIIIDGGSKDDTLKIAQQYPVRIIFELKKGRGRAYNRGITKAKGELVAFLDSDAFAKPFWLSVMVKEFCKDFRIAAVYCGSKAPPDSNFTQKCIDVLNYKGNSGANGVLYKMEALLEVEGFNETIDYLQEDELDHRLRNNGYHTKIVGELLILHYTRSTIKKYIGQNIEAGKGRVILYKYTKNNKILLYMLLKCCILFIPTLLFYDALLTIIISLTVTTIYLAYLTYKNHPDYGKLKYLIFVPFITFISIMSTFVGYVIASFINKTGV